MARARVQGLKGEVYGLELSIFAVLGFFCVLGLSGLQSVRGHDAYAKLGDLPCENWHRAVSPLQKGRSGLQGLKPQVARVSGLARSDSLDLSLERFRHGGKAISTPKLDSENAGRKVRLQVEKPKSS